MIHTGLPASLGFLFGGRSCSNCLASTATAWITSRKIRIRVAISSSDKSTIVSEEDDPYVGLERVSRSIRTSKDPIRILHLG